MKIQSYQGQLCISCYESIIWIEEPICNCCGNRIRLDDGEVPSGSLCLECNAHPPSYNKARSCFIYNDKSKDLILRYKYSDSIQTTEFFGELIYICAQELINKNDIKIDYIIPIPLHWTRLIKRTYNQAELIAYSLSKRADIPLLNKVLKRVKRSIPQSLLSRQNRINNVRSLYRIPRKHRQLIKDKNILLIDDVITTAATIEAASQILKKAGATQIYAVTLARREKML